MSRRLAYLYRYAVRIWWPDGVKGAFVYLEDIDGKVRSLRVTEKMGSALCALNIFDDGPGDGLRNASGIRNKHRPSPEEFRQAGEILRRGY
jgi:hypothetical protein